MTVIFSFGVLEQHYRRSIGILKDPRIRTAAKPFDVNKDDSSYLRLSFFCYHLYFDNVTISMIFY